MKQTKYLACLLLFVLCLAALELSPPANAAETPGVLAGGVYYIRNYGSSKYLNVHAGVDADGVNVYQYQGYPVAQQQFHVAYEPASDSYLIYAMSSYTGTNRVLDIVRIGGSIISGCNVDLYSRVDFSAQRWKIVALGGSKFKVVPSANTGIALTSFGTQNGTNTGTSPTSAGNVFLDNCSGSGTANQQWEFISVPSSNPYASMGWTFMYANPSLHSSISSGYKRYDRVDHNGIDVVARSGGIFGVSLLSVSSGTVKKAAYNSSSGNHVVIDTSVFDPNGPQGNTMWVRYLHMDQIAANLYENGTVTAGQIIGTTGYTGNVSPPGIDGTHLHFDVNNGQYMYGPPAISTINPQRFWPGVLVRHTSPIN